MSHDTAYSKTPPTRDEVDAFIGPTVLEFGTDWCGYCERAQPLIAQSLGSRAQVRHLKIEDGPGRPLGRSFKVKLWPTLIFLCDGTEVARVVRPSESSIIDEAVAQID